MGEREIIRQIRDRDPGGMDQLLLHSLFRLFRELDEAGYSLRPAPSGWPTDPWPWVWPGRCWRGSQWSV